MQWGEFRGITSLDLDLSPFVGKGQSVAFPPWPLPFSCRSSVRCCTQTGLTGRVWCSMWPRSTSTLRRKPGGPNSSYCHLRFVLEAPGHFLQALFRLSTTWPSGFQRKIQSKGTSTRIRSRAGFNHAPTLNPDMFGVYVGEACSPRNLPPSRPKRP